MRPSPRGNATPEPRPAVPPAPDFDRTLAVIEELRRQHDPKRSAAEQAEYEVLAARYPGQFVAYLDAWDGEHLTRRVLAASRSVAELHAQLRARPDIDTVRHTMTVTEVYDPHDDEIQVPWFTIESAEEKSELANGA